MSPFFSKIRNAEQTEYQDAFNQELSDFQKRIRKRAEEKIEKYLKEEREERLGPGGLDPVEVLESLPEVLYIVSIYQYNQYLLQLTCKYLNSWFIGVTKVF